MQTDHKNGSDAINRLSQNISYACLTGEAQLSSTKHIWADSSWSSL